MIIDDGTINAEIIESLPTEHMANWEARVQSRCETSGVPPECPCVNEEFMFCSIPGSKPALHVTSCRSLFKRALETSFGVVRSQKNDTESSQELGPTGSGIIDTGASKSVIGEKRVSDLLATLKPEHRSLVKWQNSETVFRFGNNGTLKSLGAVFIPFGSKWFRVEVVQGWTPFLISNAFLSFLGADLLVSQSVLRVSAWCLDVKLHRNSKGLFTVCLTELIDAASHREGHPCSEEVITWASSNNTNTDLSKEVYCTQQQQLKPSEIEVNDGMAAAKVAQLQFNSKNGISLDQSRTSHTADHGESQCSGLLARAGSEPGCSFDWPRRSKGKWKGATFAETFQKDTKYVQFMMTHTKLVSSWVLSLQSYARARILAQNEYKEMKLKMEAEMEKKIREMIKGAPWKFSNPNSLDWEVISQAAQSSGSSPRLTSGTLKRSMEDENQGNRVIPEFTLETKEEKMTKVAIMQREIDRIKAEMESTQQ
eukprot:s650_g15.t2